MIVFDQRICSNHFFQSSHCHYRMLCAFRKLTQRRCSNCLSIWARESSGQSSTSYLSEVPGRFRMREAVDNEPLGFDSELLSHARRRKFVAPRGYSLDRCWARIDEILLSEKQFPRSVRLGDLLILVNTMFVNESCLVSFSLSDLIPLVTQRVQYRDRFPTIFIAIQFLRFACNSSTPLTASNINALSNTLIHSSTSIRLSELSEFFHLILQSSPFPTDLDFSAFKSRLSLVEPLPETARGPIQFTTEQILAKLALMDFEEDLLEIGALFMEKVRGADCVSFSALLMDEGRRVDKKNLARLVKKFPEYAQKIHPLEMRGGEDLTVEGLGDEPQKFVRLAEDMNGKPAYCNSGNLILYYKDNEWQISRYPDLRSYKRLAYLLNPTLLGKTGWRVWNKKEGFLDVPAMAVFDSEFSPPALPSRSTQLGICVVEEDPCEVRKAWIEKFENATFDSSEVIAHLVDRVSLLEQRLEAQAVQQDLSDTIKCETEGVASGSFLKRIITKIDSLGAEKSSQMLITGIPDSDFENNRKEDIRKQRILGIRNLVEKKFAR